MIEGRKDLRLTFEPSAPLGIRGQRFGEDFDSDVAKQFRVARTKDLAHPAGAENAGDLVWSDPRADSDHDAAILRCSTSTS
jgi:hypothetical protein